MGSKLQKTTITLARIASKFRNDRVTVHLKDSWSQSDIQLYVLYRLFNVNSMKAKEKYPERYNYFSSFERILARLLTN
jgi:hypothetical protein